MEATIVYRGYIGIMEKKMEATMLGLGLRVYSPPEVDRMWGIWGSCYNTPKAIFYLLKGDYRS